MTKRRLMTRREHEIHLSVLWTLLVATLATADVFYHNDVYVGGICLVGINAAALVYVGRIVYTEWGNA